MVAISRQHPGVDSLKIGEHTVDLSVTLYDWRYRNGMESGHDCCQFMRNAHRIGEIGDDEAGHARQQGDRFRQVSAGRLFEVEEDWGVVMLAQFLADGTENRLARGGETTEDEDDFRSDGVDDVAELVVIEKNINELRDLQAVSGNLNFTRRCDDKVGLPRPNQV